MEWGLIMARREKRERRYQLPKSRIVLPLIIYTFIFIIADIFVAMALSLFASYTTTLKAKAEIENTRYYANIYKNTEEKDLDAYFDEMKKSGYQVFTTDKEFNVLRSNCEVTAELKTEKDEFAGYDFQQQFVKKGQEFGVFTKETEGLFNSDIIFFADKNCSYLKVDDDSVSPNVMNIFSDNDFAELFKNNSVVEFPYWTAYELEGKDGFTGVIAFKTNLPVSLTDLAYFTLAAAVAIILLTLIFIVLVLTVFRTHGNNMKMRKIVFRDEITVNRNWFWFAVKSKQLISRRRGNLQYVIVSLTFMRYRNYVLCHSFDDGEKMLRLVWRTISSHLGKKEIVAHSAVSNFPILFLAKDEEEARARLKQIIKSLESIGGDHDFKFQAGAYMIDPKIRKDADIDLLYNNASSARATLEINDDSGIAFFDSKLVEDEKWIDKITEHQKDAIEKEEFQIYYQPKYDPRTNELKGAEALIRWESKDMGFVSPGDFIPIFENSGFITEIDHYMVTHVARDQKKWLSEGKLCVPVSVNISRAHFSEVNLADQIKEMVDKEGTPHELIEIELTESAFFDDKKLMLSTIRKLKDYGFLVSMDDFGSGYSSLNSLKDMPLDILKLDAGFFRSENADNDRSHIVVAEALQLAKKLNMTTVAEGVEDKEEVDFLAAEGCSMIQGYYYAKPMPKEEFEKRIFSQPQAPASAPNPSPAPAQQESGVVMRPFKESDAEAVSELIRKTISISNKKDYPKDLMDQLIAAETPEHVLEMASWTHFYVAELDGSIIGCGAIGPFWGKEDESSLFTIFVLPEHQGKGVGSLIINTLEKDEFFQRAKRVEIPASITGVPFYLKMGYNYKDGITDPDEEHLIRLEKIR